MPHLLLLLLAMLLAPLHAASWPSTNLFPTPGGGSGTDDDEYLLVFDQQQTTTMGNAQCFNFGFNQAASAACSTMGATRVLSPVATTLKRWRVYLTTAPTANAGCAFTLFTDVGDIATTTKPAVGDAVEAGYTVLTATSVGYLEAVPAVAAATTTAGGYFGVRFNDLAGASAGDDGSCANAANTGVVLYIYGHAN